MQHYKHDNERMKNDLSLLREFQRFEELQREKEERKTYPREGYLYRD
jgi:hypothetical protein